MAERDFDLVLFGATGFTGGLTADYLAQNAPKGTRWALAGRNESKLAAVRARLTGIDPGLADLPLLVADVNEQDTVAALVRRTKVLITTVGPYLTHGEPLVRACAEAGTDYVDLTGEPEFVDRMYLAYHDTAVASGARLVHACGFDSIPHDLGARFTVAQLPQGERIRLRGVVRASGQPSGGTFHSAMTAMSRGAQMKEALRRRRAKEPRPEGRKVKTLSGKPRRDAVLGYWLVPLPTIDPLVVVRSAAALADYGPDFGYSHYAGIKTLPYLVGGTLGVAAIGVAAQVPPLRKLMLDRIKQGDGPSAERRAKSWFTVDFVAETSQGTVHTRVRGGDPGYTETAKMLAESALCLAFDDNPQTAGQVTTAVAMGECLTQRLIDAGIVFEVVS